MDTSKANPSEEQNLDDPAEQPSELNNGTPRCPRCGRVLQPGKALLFSAGLIGQAYLCPACKVIYLPDLQPLANLV